MPTITRFAFVSAAVVLCAGCADSLSEEPVVPDPQSESTLELAEPIATEIAEQDQPLLTDLTRQVVDVEYGVVGIQVQAHEDGGMTISRVIPDSPASELGLVSGDRIVAVDGMSVLDLSQNAFVQLVRGEPGTEVELVVQTAEGDEETVVVNRMAYMTQQGPRARFREQRSATEFGGIGVVVTNTADGVAIADVTEGLPAFEAGILEGDRIVAIDGMSTDGAVVFDTVSVLRGEAGTAVDLTVERPSGEVRTVRLERALMVMPERTYDEHCRR